jgi:hypothetical protein
MIRLGGHGRRRFPFAPMRCPIRWRCRMKVASRIMGEFLIATLPEVFQARGP